MGQGHSSRGQIIGYRTMTLNVLIKILHFNCGYDKIQYSTNERKCTITHTHQHIQIYAKGCMDIPSFNKPVYLQIFEGRESHGKSIGLNKAYLAGRGRFIPSSSSSAQIKEQSFLSEKTSTVDVFSLRQFI